METLRRDFIQPPLAFRGAPFWSWNDHLQIDELVRQVRDMKAHGMGGFFMHSREGLETPYMSPEWMKCIRETVKTAQETGMGAWLYDEDRWPSGFAGGLVPARGGDAFRAKLITLEERQDLPEDVGAALALFIAQIKDGSLMALRRVERSTALNPGETYLIFRREISRPSEWFNDDSYADNLNPDSVAAFIDITYEAYRKEVGEAFGKAIPGIFTDEPNIMSEHAPEGRRGLPWTDGLPELFHQRRGYDLLEVLPWLFYEGEYAAKTRHDFWYSISQRFTEAYSKQLGSWCEKNGLSFTGHFLNENDLGTATLTGGAVMPHYRWEQVPGIDMLTEQNHEFLTIKQCSSVATQFDRKRVLSETYGCSGWELTFEGQKWNGDWQYVLGVNLRCQHLALYSLRGCRKRDYPPAFNYNTTWWKYNAVVEDYFARIGRVLSEGHAVRDVLVLHPVASGWAMLGEGHESVQQVNAYGEKLNDFAQAVLATHYDFDFGDEQILASDGKVDGGHLVVGRAPYAVVIIPPQTRTLLSSTVDLLEKFLDAGGKLVVFDPQPDWIEAQPAERLAALWRKPGVSILSQLQMLNGVLETHLQRRVSLVTPQGQQAAHLLYMQRALDGDDAGKTAYFIVNNDRNSGYPVEVNIAGAGRLEEWDPLTGQVCALAAEQRDGKFKFDTYFGPAGSRLYIVDPTADPEIQTVKNGFQQFESAGQTPWGAGSQDDFVGPAAPFTRTDPNILTLDMCQYRMAGMDWSPVMEVWRAQDAVRRELGMRPNFYNGLPQRYRWALKPHARDGEHLELRFVFTVRDAPETPISLLLENADRFDITMNGAHVSGPSDGWYLDRAFNKVKLPPLKVGQNELVIGCAYTNYMELEDCYLLGDFAVNLDREITREPSRLHFGSWTSQGYPHYAGSMIYHAQIDYTPGKRARLYLGEYWAIDVAVFVNSQLAGHIPWRAANGLEITPFLKEGVNTVDIEVVSSPRNMLGPLHRAPEHEAWTDNRSFRRTDKTFTPDYVFWPWGLVGQVRIVQE